MPFDLSVVWKNFVLSVVWKNFDLSVVWFFLTGMRDMTDGSVNVSDNVWFRLGDCVVD